MSEQDPNALWGVVVGGGAAKRFGSDKRLALFGGKTLLSRAFATMQQVVGVRLLFADGGRHLPLEHLGSAALVEDASGGSGPGAGILGALAKAQGPLLVLACDVPLVDAALLRELAARTASTGKIAAARTSGGLEPLIACYPKSALRPLQAALSEDMPPLRRILEDSGAESVAISDAVAANINHPEDLTKIVGGPEASGS